MNISKPFIHRPVATTLLTVAVALSGVAAFRFLPIAPLPQVDFPTITVGAALPGASPQTMASAVATPLERQFGRIAGVTEMTSASYLGTTGITLQFDLNRDIDAAARDVQAAINAARGYLPANLPENPSYRKVNSADSPIFMMALPSDVLDKGQVYDVASSILAQKLSQLRGVGQVLLWGSALPAVRVELNPMALTKYGIGLEDVRTALSTQNANTPKGHISNRSRRWEIGANDQIFKARDCAPLIVAYRNGAPVRVSDIGEVIDSVEDIRNDGYFNSNSAVQMAVWRQPGANVIETTDKIREVFPQLQAAIPQSIRLVTMMDQTQTIRASVQDVELSLIISVILVILVVFVFLRDARTTIIPSVAVPVSLIGTFGVMYLLNYSIDNLSLMALTISTGFVVDDAIVVIENITRFLEQGMRPLQAALLGAQEIGFTVVSMSVSLVAVFIPLLMMGGVVGRLFREFAVTLSVAIAVSLAVSLTTTPMMCAHMLEAGKSHGRLYRLNERCFNWIVAMYGRTLTRVLRHPAITLAVLFGTIGLNVYLFVRRSERILSPTGQRAFDGRHSGRPGHVLPVHAGTFALHDGDLPQGPGDFQHQRYRRRQLHERNEHRADVHEHEAARGAEGFDRCGDGAAAPKAGGSPGRIALYAGLAGSAHRRARKLLALSVHPALRQSRRPGNVWSGDAAGTAPDSADHRREYRSAE